MRLKSLKFALFALLTLVALFVLSSCGGSDSKGCNGNDGGDDDYEDSTSGLSISIVGEDISYDGLQDIAGNPFGTLGDTIRKNGANIGLLTYDLTDFEDPTSSYLTGLTLYQKEPALVEIDGIAIDSIVSATKCEIKYIYMPYIEEIEDVDFSDYISLSSGVISITTYASFVLRLTVACDDNKTLATFYMQYSVPSN